LEESSTHDRQLLRSPAVVQPPSNSRLTYNAPASTSAAIHLAQASAFAPSNLGEIQRRDQLAQQQGQRPSKRRISRSTQIFSATHSSALSNSKTFTQETQIDDPCHFAKTMFAVLEEAKYPDVLGWAIDGKTFYLNQEHPKMLDVLEKYFNTNKFGSWYRQLNTHGWTKLFKQKNKTMMYNLHFYRDMGPKDFRAIIRSKIKATNQQRTKRQEKLQEKIAKAKKARVIISKSNKDKSAKTTATRKAKGTKGTKGTSKKKTATGVGTSSLNSKKRKKPPNSPDAVDNNQRRKKRSSTDDQGEEKSATKRLREHKKLHNIFWKWDMWNFPDGLDMYLENGKVQSYQNKKKTAKPDAADADVDAELEVHCDNTEDEITALLCDEEMLDSIIDEKTDKQALVDLVDRIRQDRLQQDKLYELWSNSVVPIVKGKILAPAKFAKPTDKWRKVKVGDRIGVYWRDDALFYNAVIKKQQENTRYFHLIYEDDGAQEWLDLSREDFKILEDVKKPFTVVHSTPRRAGGHTLTYRTDETPRKDNRARCIKEHRDESKPINLPGSHSHLAPFVRYSWKGLGLGIHAGTPSYNSFVRARDELAPKVTALQLLNDVRALRSWGFSGIPLQLDRENISNDMGNDDHKRNGNGTSSDPNQILTNQLRNLQDKISKDNDASTSAKDFYQTISAVRKLTDSWSIPLVRENLRTIEAQVLKLNEREARILEKCKQKGLY